MQRCVGEVLDMKCCCDSKKFWKEALVSCKGNKEKAGNEMAG